MISPNGVGLSPDEKVVYMADTNLGRLWALRPRARPASSARRPASSPAGWSATCRATSCSTAWRWRPAARSASPPSSTAASPPSTPTASTEHYAVPGPHHDQHLLRRRRHAGRLGHLLVHRQALQVPLAAAGAEAELQRLNHPNPAHPGERRDPGRTWAKRCETCRHGGAAGIPLLTRRTQRQRRARRALTRRRSCSSCACFLRDLRVTLNSACGA